MMFVDYLRKTIEDFDVVLGIEAMWLFAVIL